MRIIVRCPLCALQFDASGLEPGARFRCTCGAVVTVHDAESHAARVVRCSSCGAARLEGAACCSFCGSDFTLHEQDLHTVCPSCFARISDAARFCHHCATEILPQARAGEATALPCPACRAGVRLASRPLPEIGHAVLECNRCAGQWIGHQLLESVVRRTREETSRLALRPPPASARARSARTKGEAPAAVVYRRCPQCGQHMQRKNWGQRSGVVVDVCTGHGVWFDAEELATVLAWVREGGLDRAAAQNEENRPRPPVTSQPLPPGPAFSTGDGWLGIALRFLFWVLPSPPGGRPLG